MDYLNSQSYKIYLKFKTQCFTDPFIFAWLMLTLIGLTDIRIRPKSIDFTYAVICGDLMCINAEQSVFVRNKMNINFMY